MISFFAIIIYPETYFLALWLSRQVSIKEQISLALETLLKPKLWSNSPHCRSRFYQILFTSKIQLAVTSRLTISMSQVATPWSAKVNLTTALILKCCHFGQLFKQAETQHFGRHDINVNCSLTLLQLPPKPKSPQVTTCPSIRMAANARDVEWICCTFLSRSWTPELSPPYLESPQVTIEPSETVAAKAPEVAWTWHFFCRNFQVFGTDVRHGNVTYRL